MAALCASEGEVKMVPNDCERSNTAKGIKNEYPSSDCSQLQDMFMGIHILA